jgi:hypothetical protein
MLRYLYIVTLLCALSGCSWIAVDHYYESKVAPKNWTSDFRPGITSTKTAGYPDTILYTFSDSNFKLTLNVSYQNVVSIGPLIFPIIPMPWKHAGDLRLQASLELKTSIQFDTNSWKVTHKKTGIEISPSKMYLINPDTQAHNQEPSKVKLDKDSLIYLSYPIRAADITELAITLGSFTSSNSSVIPPTLNLTKTTGTWHFEQFTL